MKYIKVKMLHSSRVCSECKHIYRGPSQNKPDWNRIITPRDIQSRKSERTRTPGRTTHHPCRMSFKDIEVQLIVNGYLSESYSTGAGGKQGDHLFTLI